VASTLHGKCDTAEHEVELFCPALPLVCVNVFHLKHLVFYYLMCVELWSSISLLDE
jgi:hypothetical protein